MAPVIVGAAVVGAGISAYGAIKKGDAAQQAAEMNADSLHKNAADAIEQAGLQEAQTRRDSAKVIGQARANYGASGLTTDGSPMDVLESSARNAELDALTIRYGGQKKAAAFNREADIEKMSGQAAKDSSRLEAAGTLLQGVGNAFAKGKK